MSTTIHSTADPHRRLIYSAIATICKQSGFQGVTKASLETLTELMQAHLSELTRSCCKFSELDHRTTPDLTDVKMALADIGSSAYGLHIYSKRAPSQPLRTLNPQKLPLEHKALRPSLSKINQPSYIPNHFPDYPDVHSFVRTPTLREPMIQYQTVRERVANQREATEESLVKFLSHTYDDSKNIGIFEHIDCLKYPSIHIPLDPYSYLKALLPPPSEKDTESNDNVATVVKVEKNSESVATGVKIEKSSESDSQDSSQLTQSSNNSNNDNPYLREPKKIKSKR